MEYPSTGVSWLSILLAHIHAEQALEESRWRGKGHETCLLTSLWIGTVPLRLPTSLPHCPVCTAIAREGLCAQNFGYWSKASGVQRCGESWAGGRWDVNSVHFRTWYASKCMCLATFRPCWPTERRNSSEKNVILWLSYIHKAHFSSYLQALPVRSVPVAPICPAPQDMAVRNSSSLFTESAPFDKRRAQNLPFRLLWPRVKLNVTLLITLAHLHTS